MPGAVARDVQRLDARRARRASPAPRRTASRPATGSAPSNPGSAYVPEPVMIPTDMPRDPTDVTFASRRHGRGSSSTTPTAASASGFSALLLSSGPGPSASSPSGAADRDRLTGSSPISRRKSAPRRGISSRRRAERVSGGPGLASRLRPVAGGRAARCHCWRGSPGSPSPAIGGSPSIASASRAGSRAAEALGARGAPWPTAQRLSAAVKVAPARRARRSRAPSASACPRRPRSA